MTTRAVAVRALVRIEDGAFANVALPAALRQSDLDPRARAQVTDLVYGTVRWQRTLDHFVAPCVDRALGRLDPPVRAALRLGAYQLWSGVPAHAAVGETVAAVGLVAPRAKGFVNAVLRKLAAAPLPWPLPEDDSVASIGVRTSLPDWIVERLLADLGPADALATMETLNEPAAVTLRVNPRRATVDGVERELVDAGAHVTRGDLVPDALLVTGSGDVGALACVRDGRATPQDQASQAVAAIVAATSDERVLEVGAAPGGKATALGEAVDGRGLVVAADLHPARTAMVRAATRRLRLDTVVALVADGRRLPLRPGAFDAVLLDAPCSGLGVLRRRPEARWRLQPAAITELAALQRDLLGAAAAAVRPGGRLVYSVCTLSDAETVAVDEWAATALPDFRALPPPAPPWQSVGRGARLLPSAADTDGMYCLVLEAPR